MPLSAHEKYQALRQEHDDVRLEHRKEEMEALKEAYDALAFEVEGIVTPYLDKNGHEVLDPTPMAPPVGYVSRPSLVEQLRDMIQGERMRRTAELREMDTFEEADDFEVEDEVMPLDTGYQNEMDPPIRELVSEGSKSLSAKERKAAEKAAKKQESERGPPEAPPEPPAGAQDE